VSGAATSPGAPTAALTADELRELRRLHVQFGRRVDSVFLGDYRSAVRGRGMEFEEVRAYVPGDDIRHLDWNVTARSGEPFIKVFREERQNTLILVVDVSGSTRVGGGHAERRLQLARIAGGLAYAGIRNRDRVGLLTFSDRVETWLSPRPTRGHAWAVIASVYEAKRQHRGTDLAAALAFLARVQRRRATVVIVSDFLDTGDWGRVLAPLARRHELHAFLVHDPLDEALPDLGLLELVDAETGEPFVVDGAWGGLSVAAREQALTRAGARTAAIDTREDPWNALHRHFQRLARR
jgi:uncharacterized protein (DUF58 family)